MKKSLIQGKQINESLKNQDQSFDQPLYFAKDEIETIRQKVLKNDYEPTSEMLKIEVIGEHQTKELQQFILSSNGLKSFKGHQKQKQLFAQEFFLCDKKPLKIDKKKNPKNLFSALYKDLKSNSLFPNIIPINKIVIARSYDQFLWPAIIVQVQQVKTNKFKRFIYKVNFIDSQNSCSLVKKYIIEFTSQNIEKIKSFFDSKKLDKAFKIAEKMLNQQRFEKIKTFQAQHLENIIEREQIPLSTPIQLQKDQKMKQIILIIETPRIKLQQFIFQNESQTDSDCQLKSYVQKKSVQKGFQNDETRYMQQKYRSQKRSFQSLFKGKIDQTKNNLTNQENELKRYFQQKQQQQIQFSFQNVAKYITQYRNKLKNLQKRRQERYRTVENVFNFLSLPLTVFETKYFLRYSYIIDFLVLLCTQNYLNLKDREKYFIERSKKILTRLYHTLKDYEGENGFIASLKILQLCKLKIFEENLKNQNQKITLASTICHK